MWRKFVSVNSLCRPAAVSSHVQNISKTANENTFRPTRKKASKHLTNNKNK